MIVLESLASVLLVIVVTVGIFYKIVAPMIYRIIKDELLEHEKRMQLFLLTSQVLDSEDIKSLIDTVKKWKEVKESLEAELQSPSLEESSNEK